MDIMIINCASQFISCFTRYGWYLFYLIGLYIGFIVLKWVWGYIASAGFGDSEPVVQAETKGKKNKKNK